MTEDRKQKTEDRRQKTEDNFPSAVLRPRSAVSSYLQPAFLICAAVLGITVGSMSAAIKMMGIYLDKEPIPLKRPLDELENFLPSPYKVSAKKRIENQDMLEALGTEDYIQWILEDTGADETGNSRFCSLFITYYPLPDVVPHRPEECYIGGGLKQTHSEAVRFEINNGDKKRQVNVRYLEFSGQKEGLLGGEITFPVLYAFSINGEYAGGREDARFKVLMKNIFGKFSYFSKIEWQFYNNKSGRMTYPDKQEALAASKKLLSAILPVLEKEFWPGGLETGRPPAKTSNSQ